MKADNAARQSKVSIHLHAQKHFLNPIIYEQMRHDEIIHRRVELTYVCGMA